MNETECRQAVAERSLGLCEKCGQQRGAEMHHRKNRSQGGKWTPANIIRLCHDCHSFVTINPDKGRSGGWCIQRHEDPEAVPVNMAGQWLLLLDDTTVEWVEPGTLDSS